MPDVRVEWNGRWYKATYHHEVQQDSDGMSIWPLHSSGAKVMELRDKCEHCGRGDWEPKVYHSMQEAIDGGLFVESDPPDDGTTRIVKRPGVFDA